MNGDFPITYSAEPEGTATPHGNIDELIMMAELENLMKNIERYGSIGQRTMPEYYGGVDPFVEAVDPTKGMGFLVGKRAPWSGLADVFGRFLARQTKSKKPAKITLEAGEQMFKDIAKKGPQRVSKIEMESPLMRTAWPAEKAAKEFSSLSERGQEMAKIIEEAALDFNIGKINITNPKEWLDEITKRIQKSFPDATRREIFHLIRGDIAESLEGTTKAQLSLLDYIQGVGKN